MAPLPDPKSVANNRVLPPYQGSEIIELAEDSVAPPAAKSEVAPISGNLPPLEIIEVGSDFPPPPDFTPRKNEHVVFASGTAIPIALASDADGPKLATVVEMQRFIERVRALRGMNPKPGAELLSVFEEGLDIYNRTERTRLSSGIVSPVATAESLHNLAERAAKSMQAVTEAAASIYQKPVHELAQSFIMQIGRWLQTRGVSLRDPYASGKIAEAAEETYYAMILDSTHLSRVDMERLYGAGEAKLKPDAEPEVKRKLTPAEKRAKMGLGPRKGEEPVAAEAAAPTPEPEEVVEESVEVEYEKELTTEARTGFAALVERVKPAEASEKFKLYGKLKPPPPSTKEGNENSLLAAYTAMSGQSPNYSTPQQAHVYAVADAMLAWSKAELDLLGHLKKDLGLDTVAVDAARAGERASKLGEKLPKLQQIEKQNTEAIRVKLVEVGRVIAADKALFDGIKHAWKREIAFLTGSGLERVVHDEVVIRGEAWRAATKERDARDAQIRSEQERLRRNPDDLPRRTTI